MRKAIPRIFLICILGLGSLIGKTQAPRQTISGFVQEIQGFIARKDFNAYFGSFAPAIREEEQEYLNSFFDKFGMNSFELHLAGLVDHETEPRLFFQAYFESPNRVMIESWRFTAVGRDEGWEIIEKEITGNINTLYRIKLPSGRAERVRSLELTHEDIRFSFKNPVVFYDNLPNIETALVILGKGKVHFTPSDPIEEHQLELLYKKPFLEDEVDHLFVRCSNNYFYSDITIEKEEGLPQVSSMDINRAQSIFTRYYPRSFTIESSRDREILSFLPRGREVVLDFKAKRAGDLTYIYHPFSDEEVNLYDRGKKRIVSLYHPEIPTESEERRFFIRFEEKFDIEHYDLEIGYSPSQSLLSAKARIKVIPEVGALDSLKFRFNPALDILRIRDEKDRDLFYTQDRLRSFTYVYLVEPAVEEKPVWIELYYRGRFNPPNPSTDVLQTQKALSNQLIFEPRYDTYLFTRAGDWYPASADEDFFTSRLKIIIPGQYKCVANGELVGTERWENVKDDVEVEKMGNSIYTFETRQPVKYLSFIVGKFDRQEEGNDPLPMQTYVSREVLRLNPRLFDQAGDILDYYIQAFGPYPYDKLGIVLRIWPTTGGHSPASYVVLNEIAWRSDDSAPLRFESPVNLYEWEEYFLAHEIAHQWWGQTVSVSSYRDQWLSEGLAQFATVTYLKRKYGERAFVDIKKKFVKWILRKSSKGPIALGARLSYYDFDAYQTIIYNKASMVMMMLHDLLGEKIFFEGLREFIGTYQFRAATTANFIKTMEDVSGRDLGDFFQGWFYSHELPVVRTHHEVQRSGEGYVLLLRVTQTEGRFVFPLWIEWESGGEVQRRMVTINEESQEFQWALEDRPEKIRIDPQSSIPGKIS